VLAEAAAAAAMEKVNATYEAIISHINDLEDEIQQDSQLVEMHIARPDLHYGTSGLSIMKFMTWHMKHAQAAQKDLGEPIDEKEEYFKVIFYVITLTDLGSSIESTSKWSYDGVIKTF
jgi:hypothetical protein